jgi:ribonucleotide reductase beta subunit family protein with ferritin-like domain
MYIMDINNKLMNNIYKPNNYDSTSEEELLNPQNNRLTIYPIKYQHIWIEYKKQLAAFWTAEEIDFSKDYNDFIKLSENEQYFIKMILAFFSSADRIVNINLSERFTQDVKIPEAIITYQYQGMMENIHAEVYSLQIENIIRDTDEKTKLFNALTEFPCIAEKAQWAVKWIESDLSFAHRIIAFAIIEGVFFSGSFCSIYWLKKRNIMYGLCASNELIARDEGLHTNFAILLYSMLTNKLDEKEVHAIFIEAVNIEINFICSSLPCALLGMNSKLMVEYIKYVADRLLLNLGYSKIWNAVNSFDFMESISIEGKTNFFELRPTEYQKSSVLNNTRENSFVITDDF